jgi:hypothetical protein
MMAEIGTQNHQNTKGMYQLFDYDGLRFVERPRKIEWKHSK